jgi:hypothetical protein
LARIGGSIAALSLIFLPFASCGQGQLTAIRIFSAEGIWPHKAILFMAIAAAVLSIVILQRWAQFTFSLIGLGSIGIEYLFTQNPETGDIHLRGGAFVALIGLVIVLASGIINRSKRPPQ